MKFEYTKSSIQIYLFFSLILFGAAVLSFFPTWEMHRNGLITEAVIYDIQKVRKKAFRVVFDLHDIDIYQPVYRFTTLTGALVEAKEIGSELGWIYTGGRRSLSDSDSNSSIYKPHLIGQKVSIIYNLKDPTKMQCYTGLLWLDFIMKFTGSMIWLFGAYNRMYQYNKRTTNWLKTLENDQRVNPY